MNSKYQVLITTYKYASSEGGCALDTTVVGFASEDQAQTAIERVNNQTKDLPYRQTAVALF